MERAVNHLTSHMVGGLALDPGLRKTSITLEAFCRLQDEGRVRTMLVVAPLRICRTVWRQEGAKWTQFRHLTFALLHGDKKAERLKEKADIYLINPEGVDWLCQQFFGRSLKERFDIVTIDELTKFKNSQADRSKALRPRLRGVPWRWGLTGSLAPNGYMDIFGQMLILDDGAALGRYITHYRDMFFSLGFDGFTYNLQPGAEKRIIQKIAPYWLQMSADDYLQLPPLIPDPRMIDLPPAAQKQYNKMKKDMLASFPEGMVTASNSASTYSKLSQMANGCVYIGDDKKKVAVVHTAKLDALETLIEELDGKPLLLAYEFNHDLDAIRERFGDIPYLGKGTSEANEAKWIAAWNRNELPILACHPASAGHGLNLQEGNGGHVCWFGITWDLELWDQFIRRLRRSGNSATRILNHMLIVRGTIDELKLLALDDKDLTQGRLLKALNTEIRRDADTLASGVSGAKKGDDTMVTKLSRPAQAATEQPATDTRVTPKGWGNRGAAQTQSDIEEIAPATQPQRVAETITPGANRPVFGQRAQTEVAQPQNETQPIQQADPSPPARRSRRTAPAAEVEQSDVASVAVALVQARVELLKVAFNDPNTSLEDGLEIAEHLWEWATK